jgi:hypothetical protein
MPILHSYSKQVQHVIVSDPFAALGTGYGSEIIFFSQEEEDCFVAREHEKHMLPGSSQ